MLLFVDSWETTRRSCLPVINELLSHGAGSRGVERDRSAAQARSTLSVISGSSGTLRRTQRTFMQPEHFHVHTGNYIWVCARCYQQPPFLQREYFKEVSQQRQTACSVHLKEWFSSTQLPCLVSRERLVAGGKRKREYWSGFLDQTEFKHELLSP